MSIEIPALPKVSTVDELTTHMNDRLRRIGLELGAGAPGKPGATGAAGAAGAGGLIFGYRFAAPSGGTVTIDLANGLSTRLVLSASPVTILIPVFTGGAIAAGQVLWVFLDQPSAGGCPPPVFQGGLHGFASDTAQRIGAVMDDTSLTRTSCAFTFHGTSWVLNASPISGLATS